MPGCNTIYTISFRNDYFEKYVMERFDNEIVQVGMKEDSLGVAKGVNFARIRLRD